MALNDIIFVKGQGGLGRPLEGEDYISGLLSYVATLPSGFSSTDRIKTLTSVQDAVNVGINNTYSDSTAATGTFTVTAVGATNDTVQLKVAAINELGIATTYDLGTYTKVVGDSSTTLVATAIAAVINANTYLTGFSAIGASAVVTITAPKRFGIYLNSGTPITATYSSGATLAGTIAQFSSGTVSTNAVLYYHISEFFRLQPKGLLYVGLYAVPGTYTYTEIQTMQDFSGGKIRQIGIFKDAVFSSSDLTAIQVVCNTVSNLHKPLSAIYAGNIKAISDLTTLTNLATFTASNVSAVIGQDGAGQGNYLYLTQGKSITCLGATLGAVAYAKVSEDIAWISKFNISSGSECDTIKFANGTDIASASQSLLNLLDNYRYIFLIKYVGIAGSYFNDSHCAVAVTSDYAYIENNRTIDKAIRGVYSSLLPNLNSPLQLNSNGTLTDNTVSYFESQAAVNLYEMVRNSELSAFEVLINPTQNVLSTNNLTVSIKLVPIGVARQITVNIGFTLSI
jgi:hypothetical protein